MLTHTRTELPQGCALSLELLCVTAPEAQAAGGLTLLLRRPWGLLSDGFRRLFFSSGEG